MPGRMPKRPPTSAMLAAGKAGSPDVARGAADAESAIRDLQRNPALPRTGAGGDVFYRAADGTVVARPIGDTGEALVVGPDGLPVWSPAVGPTGPAGPPGPTGAAGAAGATGATGATGPAGPTNVVEVLVDFGAVVDTDATATVVGQAWVTAASKILVKPAGKVSADHGSEDALIEEIEAIATNLIAGVGFDVRAHSPDGSTGAYYFWAVGA